MFLTIYVIFTGLYAARTEITLTDLTRHPGLLAFEEREAKIIQSHRIHLHVIKLETFQGCFKNLEYTLKSLEHNDNMEEFREILQLRMKRLSELFQTLQPTKRHRRGLFNPLGTLLKTITGNMDDNDLNDIQETLNNFKTKTNELVQNNERQIQINDGYQRKINEIITHVNTQQVQIMREIANLKNQTPGGKNLYFQQLFHKLLFNIDTLERQISDIFDNIQMSKLGILPRAILSEEEIVHILKLLEDQEIKIISSDQIYEYIEAHALHNTTCIVFAIKIPIFIPGKFQYVIFESIPMNNKTIITDYNIAILEKNVTFVSQSNCQIVEQYRICRRNNLIDISDDQCISNALQGIETFCDYKEPRNRTEIRQINGYTVIIKNAINPISIQSESCGLSSRQITGTILIKYRKCSLIINGTLFNAEETMSQQKLTLIPMLGITFQEKSFSQELDLQQLSAMHMENREHVQQLQTHHDTFQKLSFGSLILILTLLTILAVRLRRTQTALVTVNNEKPNLSAISKGKPESKLCIDSGRIFLEDGAVNYALPKPPKATSCCVIETDTTRHLQVAEAQADIRFADIVVPSKRCTWTTPTVGTD